MSRFGIPRFLSALVAGVLVLGVLPVSPPTDTVSAVGALPVKESGRERNDEQLYLSRVTELLDEAIGNRVNLDRALRARRSAADYRRSLDRFGARQLGFLAELQALPLPPRLIPFHARLRAATLEQVRFYSSFVDAKMRDASIELDSMRDHPSLRASSADLDAAGEHLRRLHPALGEHTEAAVEGRLASFDVM